MNAFLIDIAQRLAVTDISNFIRDVQWIVPLVQTIHIVGIGLVFSTGTILSLSSLGLMKVEWSLAQWIGRLIRWFWTALVVLLVSGTILIVGEPERSLLNLMFQLKMLLLLVAIAATVALIHRAREADRIAGGPVIAADTTSRLLAFVALLAWLAIISAGRWIAYYTEY